MMFSLATDWWGIWEWPVLLGWPAYATMWLLAGGLFLGFKLAVLAGTGDLGWGRTCCFLMLWPGMDARPFLNHEACDWPKGRAWVQGLLCLGAGLATFAWAVRCPGGVLAGWLGMASVILALHFGAFHLLAGGLRGCGLAVKPIMGNLSGTTSLARFWGGTWNRAFTDAVYPLVARPVTRRFGAKAGLWSAFVFSGMAHELVISVPAGAGYGGPFFYFILQGLGVMIERGRIGRRRGLGRGVRGRIYLSLFVIMPAPILFHPPFLEGVMHPFVKSVTNYITLL